MISWFSVFSWFWADWISKCDLGLAGARECWLKGLHQIPSESWLFFDSLHFHIYQIVSFVQGMSCPFYCYYKWWGDGIGQGMADWNYHVGGGTGVEYHLIKFFSVCSCNFFSHRWLQHDGCCLCFFDFTFLPSLFQPPWTCIYYCREIVLSVV